MHSFFLGFQEKMTDKIIFLSDHWQTLGWTAEEGGKILLEKKLVLLNRRIQSNMSLDAVLQDHLAKQKSLPD